MPTSARRISTFGTTVFTEINMLAQQYNALNLGQGKPDFDTPPDIVMQLVRAAQAGQYNQYPPCLLYTSPSPRDRQKSRMPSSA